VRWCANVLTHCTRRAVRDLVTAYRATQAKRQKAQAEGRPTAPFEMHFRKRRDPTSWTFSIGRQYIRVEHVERPTRAPLPDDVPNATKRACTCRRRFSARR